MSSTKLSLTLLDACYMLCKLVELMADIFQFHSYNVLVLHQILQTVSPDIALSFYFHCLVKLCSMGSFTGFVVCGSFEKLFQISINHIFSYFAYFRFDCPYHENYVSEWEGCCVIWKPTSENEACNHWFIWLVFY